MRLNKSKINFLIIIACSLYLITCKNAPESTVQSGSRVDTLPFYKEATFKPFWFASNANELADFHKISPFELINQDSVKITDKSLNNKIYVADFFFATCPGICPKMTDNMKLLQDAFINDDDVMLISHSVTPNHDTPEVLRNYGREKGVDSKKWHLLTGEREVIYRLGRKAYFIEEDLGLQREEDDFLHTENFVLIDKNKHLRGIYNGLNKNDIKQIIADIKTLKKE